MKIQPYIEYIQTHSTALLEHYTPFTYLLNKSLILLWIKDTFKTNKNIVNTNIQIKWMLKLLRVMEYIQSWLKFKGS